MNKYNYEELEMKNSVSDSEDLQFISEEIDNELDEINNQDNFSDLMSDGSSFDLIKISSQYKPASQEENMEYISAYKDGDEEALNKLVLCNTRLILFCMKRHIPSFELQSKSDAIDDYFQQGVLGLMTAINRYDETKGSFSTYAYWWIRQNISRYHMEDDMIRIPVHSAELLRKYRNYRNKYIEVSGCEPSKEEVMEHFNIDESKYHCLVQSDKGVYSINKAISEDEDAMTFEDTLIASDNVEEDAMKSTVHDTIIASLRHCCSSDKEFNIMIMRFGLDGKDPRTLEEIGSVIGVTRERIRQIEKNILRRMRNGSSRRVLKDFYDLADI